MFALMMRRVRSRHTGSRAGYLWAIIEPVAWVFALKLAIQQGNSVPPLGDSFEVFFASGVIIAKTWRGAVSAVSPALSRGARGGSLPTVNRLDTAYASWLIEIITGAVVLVTALVGLQLFGFDAVPGHLLICIMAFLSLGLFALSSALALSVLFTVAPGLSHFRGILLLLMFITSGFSFLVDRMAPPIREILVWNPILHCIEWFREGFYAGYQCSSLDLVYLFSVTLVLMVIGLAGERALRRRAGRQNLSYGEDDYG